MKKIITRRRASEMKAEYDFSIGVRGKYAANYKCGTNLVLVDPELAKASPDAMRCVSKQNR